MTSHANATGPKIPPESFQLPPEPIRPGSYNVTVVRAEGKTGRFSGRPYVMMECIVNDDPYKDRKVWYSYTIAPLGFPSNKAELKAFKPFEATAKIVHKIWDGNLYPTVERLTRL